MTRIDFENIKGNFAPIVKITSVLEKHPGSSYVGQCPLKQTNGQMTDWVADIFYDPNPNKELGHGHYFAIYFMNGKSYITGAEHVESLRFTGTYDNNGNIVFPLFRHDFRYFNNTSCFCDGSHWTENDDGTISMNHTRWGSDAPLVRCDIRVIDGHFYWVDDETN
jgi:hypothetical protein